VGHGGSPRRGPEVVNVHFTLTLEGKDYDIYLEKGPATVKVEVNGETVDCKVTPQNGSGAYKVEVGGHSFVVDLKGRDLHVNQMPAAFNVRDVKTLGGPGGAGGKGGEFKLKPPMPGKIVGVKVAPGDQVKKGQVLVVLEAMKMQNELPAPRDGVVKDVLVTVGKTVEGKDVLVVLE